MTGKLFRKELALITSLSEEEVFRKLRQHCVGATGDPKIKTFFEGRLKPEQHEFRLLQVFDYGPRNQIRPEIRGYSEQKETGLTITLKISLPQAQEMLLDFAVVLNILFLATLPFIPFPKELDKQFFYIGIPICLLVSYVMAKFFFNSKTSDCVTLLERMLEAK